MSELEISVSSPGDSSSSQAPIKQSYAAAVTKRPILKKHEFEISVIDGIPTIEVPNTVISESVPLWEDFLVGRFPSFAPHVAKIHVIVNKIWTLGDKSVKIDVFENSSTSVKFRIRDASTRLRILRRGMWNIAGLPMILSKWSPILEETQPEIKVMPMWVILKNVPHSMYSRDGLGFLSSPVGNPIRLHPETELCSNFEEAKVFVEVNLSQELPKTFRFKLDQDTHATVEFVYPWLPPRCSRCKKWGHLEETCVIKKLVTEGIEISKEVELEEGEVVPAIDNEPQVVAQPEAQSALLKISPILIPENQEPSQMEKVDESNDNHKEGWTHVSPGKGSRSNEQKKSSLIYGQVKILDASRYSVMSDKEEEDKGEEAALVREAASTKEENNSSDMVNHGDSNNTVPSTEISKKEVVITDKAGPTRDSIPRSTKQKNQQESLTLKAKETLPSVSRKRNSRKHH